MPEEHVIVRRTLKGNSTRYWERLATFDIAWHPNIQQCRVKTNDDGAIDRIFTDENGHEYQERLRYLSQTEGTLRYYMIKGIAAVHKYEAEIKLLQIADQTQITWSARVVADAQDLERICAGTKEIFINSIKSLSSATNTTLSVNGQAKIDQFTIQGNPVLTGLKTIPRDTQKPLIVFLHGIGGNAENWRAQLEVFGMDYPAIALNLRGYGGSGLGTNHTKLTDYYEDIIRSAEYWGHEKFILVGLSYGAWIATAFAQAYPSKLCALIVAGGCTGMSEAGDAERQAFLSARLDPLNKGLAPKDFAQNVVDLIAGPNATTAQRNKLSNSIAAIPSETYRDALHCFCSPPHKHDFSRIFAPTFLITGEYDRLAPPAEIMSVAHRLNNARNGSAGPICYETVLGAGHLCNIEDPEAFNKYLRNALSLISQ